MLKDKLIEAFTNLEFFEYREIKTKDIPFDPGIFDMCAQNTCGKFGINHGCPPLAGTFVERKARVMKYHQAFVINKIISLNSKKKMTESTECLAQAIKELRKEFADDDVLIMGAGPCLVCEKCSALEDLPCRFPHKTQYSMEGSGINVVQMSLDQKMTYNAGNGNVGYFTLVLFDEPDKTLMLPSG